MKRKISLGRRENKYQVKYLEEGMYRVFAFTVYVFAIEKYVNSMWQLLCLWYKLLPLKNKIDMNFKKTLIFTLK